jgi:hypothetical protein
VTFHVNEKSPVACVDSLPMYQGMPTIILNTGDDSPGASVISPGQ